MNTLEHQPETINTPERSATEIATAEQLNRIGGMLMEQALEPNTRFGVWNSDVSISEKPDGTKKLEVPGMEKSGRQTITVDERGTHIDSGEANMRTRNHRTAIDAGVDGYVSYATHSSDTETNVGRHLGHKKGSLQDARDKAAKHIRHAKRQMQEDKRKRGL